MPQQAGLHCGERLVEANEKAAGLEMYAGKEAA